MKRKFIVFPCAMAALLVLACNRVEAPVSDALPAAEEPSVDLSVAIPIQFSSEVATKAVSETTLSTIQTNGFNVYGVAVTAGDSGNSYANYIENLHVTLQESGTYFDSDHVYYYPLGEKTMDFYCTNAGVDVAVADGAATVSYTLDNGRSYDLVAATAYGVAASSAPVALTFSHILSQVQVKCLCSDPQVVCKVTGVTSTGNTAGTYAFVRNTPASDAWGSLGTSAAYTVYSDASGLAVSTTAGTYTNVGETFVAFPESTNFALTWECYKGEQLVGSYARNVSIALDKGKLNNVKLTLPNNSAQTIEFSVSVAEWGSVDKEATLE